MNFRNQLISGVVLLSIFGLASCSSWRERPQENPHPQYYLTLKGHIAKPLREKVRLRFIQAYVGMNPKCAAEADPISGIKENPARSFTHVAELDKNGDYEIKVPLDKYLPGYCDWQSWGMGITLTDKEYYSIPTGLGFVNFSNKELDGKSPRLYRYVCPSKVDSDDGDNCGLSLLPGKEIPNYVRTDRSTSIKVNVNYKGKKHAHGT